MAGVIEPACALPEVSVRPCVSFSLPEGGGGGACGGPACLMIACSFCAVCCAALSMAASMLSCSNTSCLALSRQMELYFIVFAFCGNRWSCISSSLPFVAADALVLHRLLPKSAGQGRALPSPCPCLLECCRLHALSLAASALSADTDHSHGMLY